MSSLWDIVEAMPHQFPYARASVEPPGDGNEHGPKGFSAGDCGERIDLRAAVGLESIHLKPDLLRPVLKSLGDDESSISRANCAAALAVVPAPDDDGWLLYFEKLPDHPVELEIEVAGAEDGADVEAISLSVVSESSSESGIELAPGPTIQNIDRMMTAQDLERACGDLLGDGDQITGVTAVDPLIEIVGYRQRYWVIQDLSHGRPEKFDLCLEVTDRDGSLFYLEAELTSQNRRHMPDMELAEQQDSLNISSVESGSIYRDPDNRCEQRNGQLRLKNNPADSGSEGFAIDLVHIDEHGLQTVETVTLNGQDFQQNGAGSDHN
jgi:hypothetical protein